MTSKVFKNNYSSQGSKMYNDLILGMNHYMLNTELITNMDEILNRSISHRIKEDKKEKNTNPQQWEYVKKDQSMMSRQKERFFFPKENDQLFWLFYLLQNGDTKYEIIDTSKFLIEKEEKMNCIDILRMNKKQLTTYKIKGLKDTVEDDLVNSRKIDIKTFFALCITHNLNIMYIHKQKYYELICGPDDNNLPVVIHRIDTPTLKYGYELNMTQEKIDKYRNTYYPSYSLSCPLKCISSYKVSELKDICKKVNIEENIITKKTKPQLYQLLIDTL